MIYGSVCSGVEAATVAWQPLGWQAAWFAEIEPFCNDLLKHHYPTVTNHGVFGIEYTLAELGNWVHLLAKRSAHRTDESKRKKDIEDARNYLSMMDAQLSELEQA